MGEEAKLAYTSSQLKKLADDLDDMQEYLGKQVTRMDEIVDGIEAGWQGPTATSYRSVHRGAAEDAVRIGQTIQFLAEAIRLSEGGFTEQELETLEQFQADVDIEAAADALSTPSNRRPRSGLRRPLTREGRRPRSGGGPPRCRLRKSLAGRGRPPRVRATPGVRTPSTRRTRVDLETGAGGRHCGR